MGSQFAVSNKLLIDLLALLCALTRLLNEDLSSFLFFFSLFFSFLRCSVTFSILLVLFIIDVASPCLGCFKIPNLSRCTLRRDIKVSPTSVVLISPEVMQAKVVVIMDLNSASIVPHSVLAFASAIFERG